MIEINNLTTTLTVNEAFLKKISLKILDEEKYKNKNLSIALVGEQRIKRINKKYRGKNRATDVLAFPLKSSECLGEIIICLREVKKNARKLQISFQEELIRVLIHGILHLLGYNHENNELEAQKMKVKEQYYYGQTKN